MSKLSVTCHIFMLKYIAKQSRFYMKRAAQFLRRPLCRNDNDDLFEICDVATAAIVDVVIGDVQ